MSPRSLEFAEKSGEAVKAGPIGLAVILILIIACYFLFKSMSRHMKNVRENFPVDEPQVRRRPTAPIDTAAPPTAVPPTAEVPETGAEHSPT